ncbi:hypothetical protein TCAL_08074 [Tigriopus californicus]|uniref:Nucleolar pre-ribosomal-associated protein 1 C-terminal domain-containing protein n=1 Tax=Tigriopus californicus TaxID=6832 RepID=A0A553NSD8_TIGCA|nr:uncharacterized protein LOC131877426 [Tigriopus californicus]TRY68319.1 hypothetical protein TCAL_08074 [Tigriopus californicus]|eukprot:TCALIF_08074-PA protein Name:"Similar to Urb1 Nucleolar pre-ribosomal-associated protein 1 (Mus musculus)" AED:0.00 eAED:0.00 QI:173/1/1/1/0/0/2/150/1666
MRKRSHASLASPATQSKKPKRKTKPSSPSQPEDISSPTPVPMPVPVLQPEAMELAPSEAAPELEPTPTGPTCGPDEVLSALRSAHSATIRSGLRVLAAAIDDDYRAVATFWHSGGRSADLLSLLSVGVAKIPATELSLLFQAVESVALFLASEKPSDGSAGALSLTRTLMQDHYPHILLLLSPSNTGTQTKAALKMLAALVSCSVAAAREVMLKIDFEHKHFDALLKRRQKKGPVESSVDRGLDVRTAYIHFMLAFLMVGPAGSPGVVKDFLTKKTNLAQIFYGLVHDSSQTVSLILSTLKSRIIQNASISKTLKMKLFSAHHMKPILALIQWQGPFHSHESEGDQTEDLDHIRTLTIEFLTELFTSSKTGIVFQDPTCGTSGQNQNLLLFHVLQSLNEPWEKPMYARLVILALKACPDQLRPYLTTLEKLWSPRADSPIWIQIVDLIYSIFQALNFSDIWRQSSLQPVEILNVFFPDRLAKEVILPALIMEDRVVQMKALELSALILDQFKRHLRTKLSQDFTCHQKLVSRAPKLDRLKELLQHELDHSEHDPKYLSILVDLLTTMASFGSIWKDIEALNLDQILLDIKAKPNSGSIVVAFLKLRYKLRRRVVFPPSKSVLEMLLKLFFAGEVNQIQVYKFLMGELAHGNYANHLELLIWLHHFPADCLDEMIPILAEALIKFPSSVSGAIYRSKLMELPQMRLWLRQSARVLSITDFGNSDTFISEVPEKLKTSEAPQLTEYTSDSPGDVVIKMLIKMHKTERWMKPEAIADFVSAFKEIKCKKIQKLCSHVISESTYVTQAFDVSEESEILRLTREIVELQSSEKFRAKCYENFWGTLYVAMKDHEENEISYDVGKELIDLMPARYCYEASAAEAMSMSFKGNFSKTDPGLVALVWNCFGTRYYTRDRLEEEKTYMISAGPQAIMDALKTKAYQSEVLQGATKLLKDNPFLSDALATQAGTEIIKMFEANAESCRSLVEVMVQSCENFNDQVQTLLKEKPEFVQSDLTHNLSLIQLILDGSHPVQDDFTALIAKTLKLTFKGLLEESLSTDIQDQVLDIFKYIMEDDEAHSVLQSVWNDANDEMFTAIPTLKAWFVVGKNLKEPQILVKRVLAVLTTELRQAFKKSTTKNALGELKSMLDLLLVACEVDGTIEEAKQVDGNLGQNLIKILLKYGLKSSTSGFVQAKCLQILSKVVCKALVDDPEAIAILHSMVTGHSNFIGIVLNDKDPHSDAKFWLFKMLFLLEDLHPGLVTSKDVPLLLASYQGTLSKADQAIFRLIHHLEFKEVINLAEFKPVLWGGPARSRYLGRSDQKSVTNLIQRPKMSEILAHIDSAKMINSAIHFNTDLPFQPGDVVLDECSMQSYDPRFFLQLVCQICAPGEFMDRHLKIVECGALALVFAAMSSKDVLFRQVSYVALSRLHHQLQLSKLKAEKQIWIHLINLVRNGIRQSKSTNMTTLRVPSITATFLVKVSIVLHSPMDPMYGSLTKFLLAKPALNLFNIPEFHRLFHSDATLLPNDRPWILSVIRDGLKNDLDYNVAEKDYLVKILLCYYSSDWPQDSMARSKPLIRKILLRMMEIQESAFDLVKNRQIIPWITCEISKTKENSPEEAKELLSIAVQARNTIDKSMNEDVKSTSIWWKLFLIEVESMRDQLTTTLDLKRRA